MTNFHATHLVQRRRHGELTCVVVRLVRELDDTLAELLLETLLGKLFMHGARGVVVDLTGLDVVDSTLTNGLSTMLECAQCLGARPALAGVEPGVAATLVDLGFHVRAGRVTSARTVEGAMTLIASDLERGQRRHYVR